jgi:hypothetical protein
LGTEHTVQVDSEVLADVPKKPVKSKKSAGPSVRKTHVSNPAELQTPQTINPIVSDDIEIPTLMGKSPSVRQRNRSNSTLSA